MENWINPHRIFNQIKLLSTQYKGSFLLLEGLSDQKFYTNYVRIDICKILLTHGKSNSIETIKLVEKDASVIVFTIVDADFSRLSNQIPDNANILLTDTHDLETLIIQTDALEKVIFEFAWDQKLKNFEQKYGQIRDIVLSSARYLGYARWYAILNNVSLRFKGLVFSKFINRETMELNKKKFINELKINSPHSNINVEDFIRVLDYFMKSYISDFEIMNGHDIVSILSISFQKAIGDRRADEVTNEALERSLRLAYNKEHFVQTELYKKIQQWEMSNQVKILVFDD